jgi:hypothetical protein
VARNGLINSIEAKDAGIPAITLGAECGVLTDFSIAPKWD